MHAHERKIMCGIAGLFAPHALPPRHMHDIVTAMLDVIRFRGPDDSGIWHNDAIALGHVRLSIMDTSPLGHQPMTSQSGRYVMVYNGEIYNSTAIRRLLPSDIILKGHSDTEIILQAIDQLGVHQTIPLLRGMFAIALYDNQTQQLHLIRDPVGIKPLYYGYGENKCLLFSSQIRSFLNVPFFQKELHEDSLGLYFRYNYIPAPHTIYKNCFKQKPGTILTFSNGALLKEETYWSLQTSFQKGKDNSIDDFDEACHRVECELTTSVHNQLIADVPVGVFLSGGIDSSLITALACQHRANINSFSIGFEEASYNEAPFAKAVADMLGTNNHEYYLTNQEALDIITTIPQFFDEPFGDASQVPTFLISQIAKRDVTVVLSGDGGDELFFGYSRYKDIQKLRTIQKYGSLFGNFGSCLLKAARSLPFVKDTLAFKLLMAEQLLEHKTIDAQYDALFNFWPEMNDRFHNPCVAPPILKGMSDLDYLSYHDMHLYMVDDILTKVDRCSMYHSLETRVPFLDHPVVELSHRLPMHVKYRGNHLKTVLKHILKKHIGNSLVERPKKGFALPIDIWLRSSLKDWSYSLLADIKKDGMLDYPVVQRYMDEHQSGQMNRQYSLWNVLMWQQWKNAYL